jgi:F-type H+-transporting ATPase subunit c
MNFKSIALATAGILISGAAFAEEGAAVAHTSNAYAAYLGLGLAAMGGAIGQGLTAFGALSGIARNPGARDKVFVPMIIGLALIESLVIYALVVALQAK